MDLKHKTKQDPKPLSYIKCVYIKKELQHRADEAGKLAQ